MTAQRHSGGPRNKVSVTRVLFLNVLYTSCALGMQEARQSALTCRWCIIWEPKSWVTRLDGPVLPVGTTFPINNKHCTYHGQPQVKSRRIKKKKTLFSLVTCNIFKLYLCISANSITTSEQIPMKISIFDCNNHKSTYKHKILKGLMVLFAALVRVSVPVCA